MIFNDLFYPGNPKRREETAQLRAEISISFKQYTNAWNSNADTLNNIFSQVKNPNYAEVKIEKLEKSIEKDTVKDCVDEIISVTKNTKVKMEKMVTDIGLALELPKDWPEKGIKISSLGKDKVKKIGDIISGIGSSIAAGFVGYFVFEGVTVAVTLISLITNTAVSIAGIIGGAFLGAVVGGAAFILTDMIASAITGAIERKKLNEAIDALKELKDSVQKPLMDAAVQLETIANSIKDGHYFLDDNNLLVRMSDGSYRIVNIGERLANNITVLSAKYKAKSIAGLDNDKILAIAASDTDSIPFISA